MQKPLIRNVITLTIIGGLVLCAVLLVNPFNWFMPTMVEMWLTAAFSVVFAVFLSMYWQEQARDERDGVHQMFSGRVAFLVATSCLSVGVIVQSLQHNLDPWIPATLVVMILAKYISRWYAQRYM